MANSTHSESRGRRSVIAFVVIVIFVVIGLVLVALLWDRVATATVREFDQSEAQTDAAPAGALSVYHSARWTYADGDAGRVRVQRAIDSATEGMDLISRDIARSRLREELMPPRGDTIQLAVEDDAVDVRLGACPAIRAAPLGAWIDWQCGGESFRVHHALSDGVLIQRSRASDSSDVRRRFVVKGDRLTLNFRLHHDKLPQPVTFGLHYSR